jgi:hypothetical protein
MQIPGKFTALQHLVKRNALCGKLIRSFVSSVDKDERRKEDNSDEVQSSIGNFGRWQMWICFWLFIQKFPVAWHSLGIVFLAPPVESWCKRPATLQNMTDEQWWNMSQPFATSGPQGRDSCRMYVDNYNAHSYNGPPAGQSTVACVDWEYDRSVFQETIVTQVSVLTATALSGAVAFSRNTGPAHITDILCHSTQRGDINPLKTKRICFI